MSGIITGMEMPKNCIYTRDKEICNCPLLDENDWCKGQSEYNNQHCDDWEDLRKNCPLKSVDVLIEEIIRKADVQPDGTHIWRTERHECVQEIVGIIKEYCGMEVGNE